jgi:hypothetical protein
MTKIIKVSKPTKDVLTSTSLDDLYLHSSYPLLKVHAFGSFNTNILGGITITHNLGYIPYVLVFSQFVYDDGAGIPVLTSEYYQHDWLITGATVEYWGWTKIYSNKIVIDISNTLIVRPGVVKGFYYIFKDEVPI